MSSMLSAELSATCSALGAFDKRSGKYLVDEFTLNTVKDLIRYLRRDGEDHEIRRHLGQSKVLQSDLIPMLIDHWENEELFDVTLRLLVNLTNPALLLYREEIPSERSAYHNYLQILSHLQAYKEEAFTKIEIWNVFAKKLTKVLEIDWNERDEDTGLIIERILILIRNILHVPADLDSEKRPENDASIHDQVLWALNQSGILDILLYMSSENEKQYFMHILEIISHLLREQNPTSLADAALQRSVDEKLKDEQELLLIRSSESKKRNDKIRQYSASRHSRFGGTYVVQNMKSISDNELISFKPLTKMANLEFGTAKKDKLKKPKNRRPVETETIERRSAFAVRLFLKEFCVEFLNASYNPLMHYVKDVLVRAKAQQNDESYYLWALKFFMEFNRGHNFIVGLVSETMSVPMFHYVQQQMEKYFDMIKVEKKKCTVWVRRLHLSLKAYKELLNTLQEMDKSSDITVKESAEVLKSNIFYVLEYREFMLTTFLSYDDTKMPRTYLVDLLETAHLFLKMLEHFCKKTGLVVQKKVKRKAPKKKKTKEAKRPKLPAVPEPPNWEEIRPQIAAVLTSGLDSYPPPFDAASDVPIEDQKEDCMKKVQRHMMEYKFEDAVGTFRAAREVWPDEGIFGVSGMPEEEELNMLETIYVAELGVELSGPVIPEDDANDESEEDDEEEEEEARSNTQITETEFDFNDFGSRFCNPRVVSACAYLLEGFEKNTPYTNHCIVKMLHRVAWDYKHPCMLFQASLFLTFQRILNSRSPLYQEIEKFAIYILQQFTEMASKNPKLFIELLFWKNIRDAVEIENGYNLYDNQSTKGGWTEEEELELQNLYMENQRNPTTNQDVIDWIMENLINQSRSRRNVIKKLKDMGLIFKAPTKKCNVKTTSQNKVPVEFSEEEDEMLRTLWEQFKHTSDPMGALIIRMPHKRPKHRYVDRLLELGIINDKKECRKKRSKKSNSQSDDDKSSASENDVGSDSDSSRSNSPPPKPKPKPKPSKKKPAGKIYTANQVAKILVEAVDSDLSEALKWLAENLEEVALDQEAEGFDPDAEGIPLVPVTSEAIQAMENVLFQNVLKAVGVHPPFDEQEIYWRIPGSLHFETIRKRTEIILKAVDKNLIISSEFEQDETLTSAIDKEIDTVQTERDDASTKQDTTDDDTELSPDLRNSKLKSDKQSKKSNKRKTTKKHTDLNTHKTSDVIDKNRHRSKKESSDDDDDDDMFEKLRKSTSQHVDEPTLDVSKTNRMNKIVESDSEHERSTFESEASNDGLNQHSRNSLEKAKNRRSKGKILQSQTKRMAKIVESDSEEEHITTKRNDKGASSDDGKSDKDREKSQNKKRLSSSQKKGKNEFLESDSEYESSGLDKLSTHKSRGTEKPSQKERNKSQKKNKSLESDSKQENQQIAKGKEKNKDSDSSGDDLFDKLRKDTFQDKAKDTQLDKITIAKEKRKRSRSSNTEFERMSKIAKIDENDEGDDDTEDLLSFAKKTLQVTEMPDTEDILGTRPLGSDAEKDSDNEITQVNKKKKKRLIIDDDSD